MTHRLMLSLLFALGASPALAASGPFFSLTNTNFVVLVAFIIFVGFLIYMKVPGLLMGMLDKRAETIRNELDEARALRDEAKALLASYERKQAEVQAQADRIVESAKEEAAAATKQGKADIKASVARRLAAAEDRIKSAQANAVKEVRDRAVEIAVEVAGEVITKQMAAADANKLIDDSIDQVGGKLH